MAALALAPSGALPSIAMALTPAVPIIGPTASPSTVEVGAGGGSTGALLVDQAPVSRGTLAFDASPARSIPAMPRILEAWSRLMVTGWDGLRAALPPEVARLIASPRGADLITELSPFDRASLEDSFSRFLDLFASRGLPLDERADRLPAWIEVAALAVVIEAARRRVKGRSASRTMDPGKGRRPTFQSLF
jgi:hypothetical protein